MIPWMMKKIPEWRPCRDIGDKRELYQSYQTKNWDNLMRQKSQEFDLNLEKFSTYTNEQIRSLKGIYCIHPTESDLVKQSSTCNFLQFTHIDWVKQVILSLIRA